MKTNRPLTPSGQEKSICSIKLTQYKNTESPYRLRPKPIVILPLYPYNINSCCFEILYLEWSSVIRLITLSYYTQMCFDPRNQLALGLGCACTVCTGLECVWKTSTVNEAADCTGYFSSIIILHTHLFFSTKTL